MQPTILHIRLFKSLSLLLKTNAPTPVERRSKITGRIHANGLSSGARTHGLVIPNHALCHLSYTQIWMGWPDSNRRSGSGAQPLSESKSDALPTWRHPNISDILFLLPLQELLSVLFVLIYQALAPQHTPELPACENPDFTRESQQQSKNEKPQGSPAHYTDDHPDSFKNHTHSFHLYCEAQEGANPHFQRPLGNSPRFSGSIATQPHAHWSEKRLRPPLALRHIGDSLLFFIQQCGVLGAQEGIEPPSSAATLRTAPDTGNIATATVCAIGWGSD